MNAKEAIDQLQPQKWAATPATERLHLLEEVRENMKTYADELAASDAKMKNDLMGEELFSQPVSMIATVVPIANTVTACIDLYESLIKGEMLKPISINKVKMAREIRNTLASSTSTYRVRVRMGR